MSSAQGFRKALSPWRDPLRVIKGRECAICGQPATCAVLAAAKIGPACNKHGERAQTLGYQVVFPQERGLNAGINNSEQA